MTAGVIGLWSLGSALFFASFWSPALGRFASLLCLHVFGHLGLSFVLVAAIATPGYEMRAIPHLWTLLTGRETNEHFCPDFLHRLDAWETGRVAPPA